MSVVAYKCKNCGGELLFDPDTQQFHCEYCGSYFSREELEETPPEKPADDPLKDEEFYQQAVEYVCPNCGAQVVTEESTAATTCYYCHSPVVLSPRLSKKLRPDRVIPFALKKEEAQQAFENWQRKKWFLNRSFLSQSQLDKMVGVYFPYWKINCRTRSHLEASAAKIRTWRTGDREYTETERYHVVRGGRVSLENLTFTAMNREDSDLTRGVCPYDFDKAVDFSMAYLSGFQAERRMTEKQDIRPQAKGKIEQCTRQCLQNTITGYTTVTVDSTDYLIEREDWEYLLIPAWILTYQYRGKEYYYAVNGQTGKTCGSLPLSMGRLAALFAGVTAAAFLLLCLIGGFLL